MPNVNSVWGGDPFYGTYPSSQMSTWPMVPAVYQAPVASVAQSASQVVDMRHSTATQITTTTTSFVSVIDASSPKPRLM